MNNIEKIIPTHCEFNKDKKCSKDCEDYVDNEKNWRCVKEERKKNLSH